MQQNFSLISMIVFFSKCAICLLWIYVNVIHSWRIYKKKLGLYLGRRDALRLRRLFRTRMLVERGDEEVRRKRIDLWRRRMGCPWSIDLPHGTRQSIVPWDSRSLSRSSESWYSFFLPPSSVLTVFLSSFFSKLSLFLLRSPSQASMGHGAKALEKK